MPPRTEPTTSRSRQVDAIQVATTANDDHARIGGRLVTATNKTALASAGVSSRQTTTALAPSHVVIDECASEMVRIALEQILGLHEAIRDGLKLAWSTYAIPYPKPVPTSRTVNNANRHMLDTERSRAMSDLAQEARLPMRDLIMLVRGESMADPRPNKALRPSDYRWLLAGYEHVATLVEAATVGFRPEWKEEVAPPAVVPSNHQSANRHLNAVVRSIRSGQDAGQYLVVDDALLDVWKTVHVSPLGAVEKKDIDPATEVRLIHDLSFPRGKSTNTATDRATMPNVHYRCVATIARRIDDCKRRFPGHDIKMKKGDVKGAFRHLMVHHDSVGWMGACVSAKRWRWICQLPVDGRALLPITLRLRVP